MGMHPDLMKAPSYYTKPLTKGGQLPPPPPPPMILPLPVLPPLFMPVPMQAAAPPQMPQIPMAKGGAKAKAPVW